MTTTSKEQIVAAIGAHGLWKARLLSAIEKGACEHDPAKVECDNQCDLGKWLYGVIDASLRAMPDYQQVRTGHARFHKEAANVLRLALAGQKDAATKALHDDYARCSSELVQLLVAWKNK